MAKTPVQDNGPGIEPQSYRIYLTGITGKIIGVYNNRA